MFGILTNGKGNAADNQTATNEFFDLAGAGGEMSDSQVKVELLKKNIGTNYGREFFQDALDPEGNWGLRTNDSQLSVRTYMTNFVVGEAMPIIVLWRNCGAATMTFPMGSDVNYPFTVVLRRDGEILKPKILPADPNKDFSGWAQLIPAKSQYRHTARLDKIYRLDTAGTYELLVERWTTDGKFWTPPLTNRSRVLIRSGTLRFTLTPPRKDVPEVKTATNILRMNLPR